MRKTLTALAFAAALPALAFAAPSHDEPPHDGGPGPKGGPEMMFRQLDLTKEQRHEIGKLMGDEMRNQREITHRYLDKLPEAERKAMQAEMQASRDKVDQAIRAKLTSEQQKQFDEMREKMKERRAERAEFEAWKAERDKAQ